MECANSQSADLDITVNLLIQIDKLVQLIESPVFTYLRLQLLEPEKYPFLYKCLYGLLMLLPQSSAFGALKNRLNSVSAIGYLHIAPRAGASGNTYERTTRLKGRADEIKWGELLEKFRTTQEKARRQQMMRSQRNANPSRPASVLGMPTAQQRVPTPTPVVALQNPNANKKNSGLGGIGGRLASARRKRP